MKVRISRLGYALSAMAVVTIVQIPMMVALGHLSGRPGRAGLIGALLLIPSAAWARNPWEHRPRSRLELYLVMWPVFVWWVICAAFLGFAAIGLPIAALSSVTVDSTLKASDFGGCCEPKCLRVLPGGDVLTAESGPPTCIKRFSSTGEFIEVVAVVPGAKGDCVRVTVAASPDGSRYYMLDTTKDVIRVFAAKNETERADARERS